MGYREDILKLPFVRAEANGGTNWWSVAETGDRCVDLARGRFYGALYLHFLRRHNNPSGMMPVASAMDTAPANCATRLGFILEFVCAVVEAPNGCDLDLALAATTPLPEDRYRAILSLPFVHEKEDGEVCYFRYSPSGDSGRDQAAGRYYAGRAAQYMRLTGDLGIMGAVSDEMRSVPGFTTSLRPFRVGFYHTLTNIALSARTDCTQTQREVRRSAEFAACMA